MSLIELTKPVNNNLSNIDLTIIKSYEFQNGLKLSKQIVKINTRVDWKKYLPCECVDV